MIKPPRSSQTAAAFFCRCGVRVDSNISVPEELSKMIIAVLVILTEGGTPFYEKH